MIDWPLARKSLFWAIMIVGYFAFVFLMAMWNAIVAALLGPTIFYAAVIYFFSSDEKRAR